MWLWRLYCVIAVTDYYEDKVDNYCMYILLNVICCAFNFRFILVDNWRSESGY